MCVACCACCILSVMCVACVLCNVLCVRVLLTDCIWSVCVCHVCMYMHFMYEIVCMCDLYIACMYSLLYGMYDIYGMYVYPVCMTYNCMFVAHAVWLL